MLMNVLNVQLAHILGGFEQLNAIKASLFSFAG